MCSEDEKMEDFTAENKVACKKVSARGPLKTGST